MRLLVRTEIGLIVSIAAGVVVAYVGVAIYVTGLHRFAGAVVLVAALWAVLYAPFLHDRIHRERGEESHAVWGRGDRRKPPWWGAL